MSLKKILGALRKADLDYNLIKDNDKIAVGISGGKDSLLLLYALKLYQRPAYRYDHKKFEIIGIHLEMGFPNMDFCQIREFAKENDITFIDYPTRLYDILKLHPKKNGEIDCSLCSTLKKGAMVKASKEYGCNKIAFAHHGDDAIETLFMNMEYGGRIKTFTPAMHLERENIDFIRPLIYCFEKDIINTAVDELHLPIVKSTCPNDGYTKRQETKIRLQEIYASNPQARINLLNSLSNNEQLQLWEKGKDYCK